MKSLFYIIVFSFYHLVFAQKEVVLPIESITGDPLVVSDSLSFEQRYLGSEFYLDSVSKEPYSGKALKYYNKNKTSFDSINLLEGVKQGWQKTYFNENGKPVLGYLGFYDQSNRVHLSASISQKREKHSNFARFYLDTAYFYFEIKYRKSGKVIVKQLISLGEDYRSKNRLKFNSLKELEFYFINFEQIYSYCKQAGYFGETKLD
jgi:hypothetical protein